MQTQRTDLIAQLSKMVQAPLKLIASNQNDYLVELDNQQRLIVNLIDKTIHSTLQRDDGILFAQTGYQKNTLLTPPLTLKIEKYKDEARTTRVMQILNLDSTSGWSEIDRVGKLSLIHYNDEADMQKVGHLRGTLVDVERGIVVCSSFGYTPTVKSNVLEFCGDQLVLEDEDNKKHEIPKEELVFKRFYEGVIIRVIFYENEIYRLTHKKIRPLKSRWGNSPSFLKMYQDAGAPTDAQLFNLNKPNSPWCYVFSIVHPKLLIATKQPVDEPYAVLLDLRKMWSTGSDCPFPLEEVETECVHTFQTSPIHDGNKILKPEPLSLDEANHHLKYGYHYPLPITDLRQSNGEALIITQVKDGQVVDIVKMNSVGYDYRFKLRGGTDPNLYHRFFELVDDSYKDLAQLDLYQDFKKKYIPLQVPTQEQLETVIKQLGYLVYPLKEEIPLERRRDKYFIITQIWLNYILALPIPLQPEALNFLQNFIQQRNNVIRWLQNYHRNHIQLDANVISPRGINLIMEARKTGKNLFKAKKYKTEDEAICTVIRNYTYKEWGTSLYALVKKMSDA